VSTGAKIAIGCVVVVFLASMAAVVGVVGLGWWAKSKVEQVTGNIQANEDHLRELHKKAEAAAPHFQPPADGVIQEERLVKFLEVRKRIFGVYEAHRSEFEAAGAAKEKPANAIDALKAAGTMAAALNEARIARAEGLVAQAMSEAEYEYLAQSIYKGMFASAITQSTGTKSVSEAADQMSKLTEELAKQAEQQLGPQATKEQKEELRKQLEEIHAQRSQAQESARQLDVPPANQALFKKYESDIRKYSMAGLELIGL
jgi:hypothetical protein